MAAYLVWVCAADGWRLRSCHRQPVLAARSGRAGGYAAARAVREPAAAGPVAYAGRQGPGALDALRRQRTGAGPRVLEELLHVVPPGSSRRSRARLYSPPPGGG